MNFILLSIHILVCISLIGIVLIQGGKGAEVGAAFGAGASNTIFGASGGQSFIGKMTAGAAVDLHADQPGPGDFLGSARLDQRDA